MAPVNKLKVAFGAALLAGGVGLGANVVSGGDLDNAALQDCAASDEPSMRCSGLAGKSMDAVGQAALALFATSMGGLLLAVEFEGRKKTPAPAPRKTALKQKPRR